MAKLVGLSLGDAHVCRPYFQIRHSSRNYRTPKTDRLVKPAMIKSLYPGVIFWTFSFSVVSKAHI